MRKKLALVLALTLTLQTGIITAFANDIALSSPYTAQVYAGENHSAIVKADGTLWTFGGNHLGQLGNGKRTLYNSKEKRTSNQDQKQPVKIMSNIIKAAVGDNHTLALTKDNVLYGFGSNRSGQLGALKSEYTLKPVKIMDGVTDVYANGFMSAVIKEDHSLWLFGAKYINYNTISPKGEPSTFSKTPYKFMSNIRAVAINPYYGMALTMDNDLYMWGEPRYLGPKYDNGDPNAKMILKPVKMMSDVASISGIQQSPLVVTTDGKLYGWGFDGYSGKLATTEFFTAEPKLLAEDVSKAISGINTNFFIKTDGSLWGLGALESSYTAYNNISSIGGGLVDKDIIKYGKKPIKIMDNVVDASACRHVLAIDQSTQLWSWGENNHGKLGNGKESIYDYKVVDDGEYMMNEYFLKTNNEKSKPGKVLSLLK